MGFSLYKPTIWDTPIYGNPYLWVYSQLDWPYLFHLQHLATRVVLPALLNTHVTCHEAASRIGNGEIIPWHSLISGWWFGTSILFSHILGTYFSYIYIYQNGGWNIIQPMYFSHILGISSSQLTLIFFTGVAQPPTRYIIGYKYAWFKGVAPNNYLTIMVDPYCWFVESPQIRIAFHCVSIKNPIRTIFLSNVGSIIIPLYIIQLASFP